MKRLTAARPTASRPDVDPAIAAQALRDVLPAAQELGLDVTRAEAVLQESADRLGLVPEVYVLALVGGTGVGKSTLLNALAGETVSAAGVIRPTTSTPVAWVPSEFADRLKPLLARFGVVAPRTYKGPGLGNVVVLDLPDVDSMEIEHRATVEEVLPRVDVVAWVTDPEKYADAVLHDGFLRRWLPRLDRQIVVLNKVDRLDAAATTRIVHDLAALVAAEMPAKGGTAPRVIPTSATTGETGVKELRSWLAEAADAKAVVVERFAAATRSELADIAIAAGAASGVRPLIAPKDRTATLERAVGEVLRVIDARGAENRAVAATRAVARRRGTGPVGLLTSALYRALGRGGRGAQPTEYLRQWRTRASMTGTAEAVRAAVLRSIGDLPAPLRARYAAASAAEMEQRLGAAADRAIGRQGDVVTPSSRWWPILGFLQTANQLALIAVAAWIVFWIIARPQVTDVEIPVVGLVPTPLVLIAGALIVGYLLARILSIHAGWIGRRWARRLTKALRAEVALALEEAAFAPVDRLEAARARIGEAWARVAGGPADRRKSRWS